MSEGNSGPPPQVFVVDSQASYITMPDGKKPRWAREGQKFLPLLLGLVVLGLVVEGCLIYKIYQKTEALSLCKSHPQCHNLSTSPEQQIGNILSQKGSKDSNEIPPLLTNDQRRPFAHLLVSQNPIGENDVVQWDEVGEARTNKMKYEKGRLTIEEDGFYYLYSKVELNAAMECEVIYHSIVKETKAYDHPITLMKSKSNRCWRSRNQKNTTGGEDLKNSFLGGIYHLESGDRILVTVNKIGKLNPGSLENFMGAFMISK